MSKKYVYLFREGSKEMKELLGGKGANLAEMTNIGLPVPPGITVTTDACRDYFANDKNFPAGLEQEIWEKLKDLEAQTGKNFGSESDPLLLSVRSGAVFSMPGMMDTVLNLGLNDESVKGLAEKTGNERFAQDCYRRFIQMYSNVVLSLEHHVFDSILEREREAAGVKQDNELSTE